MFPRYNFFLATSQNPQVIRKNLTLFNGLGEAIKDNGQDLIALHDPNYSSLDINNLPNEVLNSEFMVIYISPENNSHVGPIVSQFEFYQPICIDVLSEANTDLSLIERSLTRSPRGFREIINSEESITYFRRLLPSRINSGKFYQADRLTLRD